MYKKAFGVQKFRHFRVVVYLLTNGGVTVVGLVGTGVVC